MIHSLIYGKQKRERELFLQMEKEIAAYAGDDTWDFQLFGNLDEVERFFSGKPLLEMACYDVEEGKSVSLLAGIRKAYQRTYILLVADQELSPMAYLRPGIMANSLLLRPWTKKQAYSVLKEFMEAFLEQMEGKAPEGMFIADGKDGKALIPMEQIYYFEAREKKIYVCTGKEEIGFYHTIDALEKELPEGFLRCHRSFIVNQAKIRKIMLSQNLLYLADGFDVPLSRSYKAAFKGMGK